MNEVTAGVIGLIVLLGLFLTGIELSFCMTLVGFIGFAYLSSFSAASNLVVKDFFDTFTSYGFTVIPLFLLMGQIASNSNIAKRLYMAAHKWVGHVPGGNVRLDPRHGCHLFQHRHPRDGPSRI
jgi:C4-dicarboxylate transporter DctM subunit